MIRSASPIRANWKRTIFTYIFHALSPLSLKQWGRREFSANVINGADSLMEFWDRCFPSSCHISSFSSSGKVHAGSHSRRSTVDQRICISVSHTRLRCTAFVGIDFCPSHLITGFCRPVDIESLHIITSFSIFFNLPSENRYPVDFSCPQICALQTSSVRRLL